VLLAIDVHLLREEVPAGQPSAGDRPGERRAAGKVATLETPRALEDI